MGTVSEFDTIVVFFILVVSLLTSTALICREEHLWSFSIGCSKEYAFPVMFRKQTGIKIFRTEW